MEVAAGSLLRSFSLPVELVCVICAQFVSDLLSIVVASMDVQFMVLC
jgi:hypothetical protein